jgi:hypothetical protein
MEGNMRTKIKINGNEIDFIDNPNDLLTMLLQRWDLEFWSFDALKELLFGSLDFLIEFCQQRKTEIDKNQKYARKKITSFLNRASKLKKYFPRSQEQAVQHIYNVILGNEGMSLLPGFGMTDKFKDAQYGNPEITSVAN